MPSLNLPETFKHLQLFSVLMGFFVSLVATWLVLMLSQVLNFGHDKSEGVQKFHVNPTSRLGGIAICLGFCVSVFPVSLLHPFYVSNTGSVSEFQNVSFWFLLTSMPVWLAGLVEDLTHRVGPTLRLIMATLSAAWLFSVLGVSVTRTDVWPIDSLLDIPGASLCVTLLVVAGFTHSVNIVDGFHGLACGLVIIALSALAYMAWRVDDSLVLQMSLFSIAVVLGFFVFNWPRGAVFLGDAGAYLVGFWLVELGILLVLRNPNVSPMAPVVAALLPLIETLYSMYRRKVVSNHPINHPDALHLHTLVYRRLVFNPAKNYSAVEKNALNARVAIYFWSPGALFAILACIFLNNTVMQLVLMLSYVLMYIWLYVRLVRFNAPSLMRLR
jgi:UDP-N-acetylmuramyl pentapeptide phosphotransferase/UDP-N-acetylglucosamine-1-phosphate transferase